MRESRKHFFVRERNTHGEKKKEIEYGKPYSPQQVSIVNKDFAHNAYYYPNGETYIKESKLAVKNIEIRNDIVLNLDIRDSDIHKKIHLIGLGYPTYIATRGDSHQAHWLLEEPLTANLSGLVSHAACIAEGNAKKVDHKTRAFVPGSIRHDIKKEGQVYYYNGNTFEEAEPETLRYLPKDIIEKNMKWFAKKEKDAKKYNKVFKDCHDVNLLSLSTEEVAKAIPASKGMIVDKQFYTTPGHSPSVNGLPKDMIAQYAGGVKESIDKFLEENFEFTIFGGSGAYSQYTYNDVSLLPTEKGLYIATENANGDLKQKLVLMGDIKVLGYGETTKSLKGRDNEYVSKVFIIEHDGEMKVVFPETRTSSFNSTHMRNNLAFLGSDSDLVTMFQILNSEVRRKYIFIDESGWSPDYMAIGNHIVYKDRSKDYVEASYLPQYVNENLENISVEEFADKMAKLWKGEKIQLFVLGMLALAGMDFWKQQGYSIMPFILINGTTGAGKSELIESAMSFIGYNTGTGDAKDSRLYMVNDLTSQPISTIGTDAAVLVLDEFTKISNSKIENNVRNIINGGRGSRGHIGGNVYYNYKSPILLGGEDMPISNSVVNRAMFLDISVEDRAGHKNAIKLLSEIKKYTCINEIVQFYLDTDPEIINKKYKESKEKLVQAKLTQRESDARAYSITMLQFFPIMDESDALEYISEHVAENRRDDKYESNFDAIQDIIMQALIVRQARVHIIADSVTEEETIKVTLHEEYYKKNITSINKYANAAMEEGYDIIVGRNRIEILCHEEEGFDQQSVIDDVFNNSSEQHKKIMSFMSVLNESYSAKKVVI